MPSKQTARQSAAEPLLDRKRCSTAEGALPVHTRIAVLDPKTGWEQGLITSAYATLDGKQAVMMYKVLFDSTGKEQEVDLRRKDAKLVTTHVADTPRSQRRSHTEVTAAPMVGVTQIPSPSRLNGFKLPELRKICAELGLESKGQKKDVVAILSRAHSAAKAVMNGGAVVAKDGDEAASADDTTTSVAALTARVAELERSVGLESTAAALATAEAEAFAAAERTTAAALANAEETISELRAALAKATAEAADSAAQVAACEEREERLQAELQELKGSVRVLCCLRPPKSSKASGGAVAEASGLLSSGITRSLTMRAGTIAQQQQQQQRTFEFDRVFDASAKTEEVYEELRPLAKAVVSGSRATVLAYGQTGSGKTYTMLGMQRLAVDELLTAAAKVAPREGMLELRLGIVEVHNEKLIDLLDDQQSESTSNGGKLELRQGKDGHPYVDGLTWHGVASADAAEALVHSASVRRVTADNGLNERSSRSHLVLLYQLHAASAGADSSSSAAASPRGLLTLVDLAGSERLARTEASGTLQTETAAINKSLSALGDVMTAIAAKDSHVPFRNSKLTYLLQPALAKGSRVMFIIAASPDACDANETLVSLGFGTRARNAQLGPERARASHAHAVLCGGASNHGGMTPSRPAGATTPGRPATTPGRPAGTPTASTPGRGLTPGRPGIVNGAAATPGGAQTPGGTKRPIASTPSGGAGADSAARSVKSKTVNVN